MPRDTMSPDDVQLRRRPGTEQPRRLPEPRRIPADPRSVQEPRIRPAQPVGPPAAVRIRRAVLLIVLSVLAPGSAQRIAGSQRWGRRLLRLWLGFIAVALGGALLWWIAPGAILWLATSPILLYLAAGVCFAIAIAWPLVILDAWRLARPTQLPQRARLGITGLVILCLLLTAVPMVGLGRRLSAAGGLLDNVFGIGTASAAVSGRYNVLLLGGDAGADRIGVRPDSITLASIDENTGRTVLFSLPRNLENVKFPEGTPAAQAFPRGYDCGDSCLLNGVYKWGQEHSNLFPGVRDPGAEAMKQAVQWVSGLKVNYYVLIDLNGFRDLINAMGGITITVNERVPIGGGTSKVSGYIEPGVRKLSGYEALWFARSRHGSNDYARMQRQRCVMSAMVDQLDPGTVLARFQKIAGAAQRVMSTDLPSSELATFIDLAAKAKGQKIRSVSFVPPLINPAYPDFDVIRQRVIDALVASKRSTNPRSSAGSAAAATSSPRPGSTSAAGQTAPQKSATASGSMDSASGAVAVTDDVQAACSPGGGTAP